MIKLTRVLIVMAVVAGLLTIGAAPTEAAAPDPADVLFRINAGNPDGEDLPGTPVWAKDDQATRFYPSSNPKEWPPINLAELDLSAIPDYVPDEIFETQGISPADPLTVPLSYEFRGIPAGTTVEVRLFWVEVYENYVDPDSAGNRVFDVVIEGETALDNVDVYAMAGPKRAIWWSLTATVWDGTLDVDFYRALDVNRESGSAMVSAIEVIELYPPSTFDDVPVKGKEWMQPSIEAFYEAGITRGCALDAEGDLIYCPEREVNRAEMAVFLLRALHYPGLPYDPADQSGTFDDMPVDGKEWMQQWVEEFYDLGITEGCQDNPLRYCPERPVTRAEMAVFILRALHGANYTPPAASHTFADVPVAGKEWMQPWIEQFYAEGITSGCGFDGSGDLIYCPERAVTRAETAVFILRAFDELPQPQ